nr:MetaGeneMark_Unknown Function [uncultured bacterium]ALS89618.1 MetaGeneMark_Unknown Function [uncultured bacterium]
MIIIRIKPSKLTKRFDVVNERNDEERSMMNDEPKAICLYFRIHRLKVPTFL